MTLYLDKMESPIGTLLLVTNEDEALIHLDFEKGMERLVRIVGKHQKPVFEEKRVEVVREKLNNYFDGDLDALDQIKTELIGTDFQKTVWRHLKKIRTGQTMSYQDLAQMMGKPKSVRAVATANAQNPISLIYPCHRVIGTDGNLRGYAGGVDKKDWLLRHEGVAPTWN